MLPTDQLRSWTRQVGDTTYVCTTDPKCVDPEALNSAFDSDIMWWAKASPKDQLERMIEHSLCLSISVQRKHDGAEPKDPERSPMIGFARIITDYVSFGYLTDVYVLKEHQGNGLGRWMMQCLEEVLHGWSGLRRFVIVTSSPHAARLYETTLGAQVIQEKTSNLTFMQRLGPATVHDVPVEEL